jgi:hypothetical protein
MDEKYPVFNEELLTPYNKPPLHWTDKHPPAEIIDDYEEYEVESILQHRRVGQGYQYLIKWKDYPHSENTWEPSCNLLPRAAIILAEYVTANKLPQIITAQVPIFPTGYWLAQYSKRYEMPNEQKEYKTKLLFLLHNGKMIPIKTKPSDHEFTHCKYEEKLKNIFNNGLLHPEDDDDD